MNTIYLLLGSNLGNSRVQISKAIVRIEKHIGKVHRKSDFYYTAAWGNTEQPDFLNQVIIVESSLVPLETMRTILKIEETMGRRRTVKNAPRNIDIDILFFNKKIVAQPQLTIPHPEIQNRRFVLVPLNQLSPNLQHPLLKTTIHQLLLHCKDPLNVKKF